MRDIDLSFDLVWQTQPIYITPYYMSPVEFRKLKVQFQKLLFKGFIRPILSPYGTPLLFMKKKYDSIRMCIK